MKNSPQKRPWTRAEKSLFLSPVLLLLMGVAVWWRQRPTFIPFGMQVKSVHVRFSPDSQRLVAISGRGETNLAAVYDVESGRKLVDLKALGLISSCEPPSWSPDGKRIAIGFKDAFSSPLNSRSRIAIWDSAKGALLSKWNYEPPRKETGGTLRWSSVQYSSDGKRLIGTGFPATIFNAQTGQRLFRFRYGRSDPPYYLNPDETLAVPHDLTAIEVGDITTNKVVWAPKVKLLWDLHWSKRNVLCVLVETVQGKLEPWLWDGDTERQLPSPTNAYIYSAALSDAAPFLAYAESKRVTPNKNKKAIVQYTLRVWNYETGHEVWKHTAIAPRRLLWSPDGKWLTYHERHHEQRAKNGDVPERIVVVNSHGEEVFKSGLMNPAPSQDYPAPPTTPQWSPNSKLLAIPSDTGVQIVPIE